MTGKNLVLNGLSFNNAALKYLRDDVVLPKQGALMLIDPTHPANAWASGVPADQALLPNIAGSQLSALTGSSASTDTQPSMFKPVAFAGAAGLMERTSKGGLHGVPSKVSAVQSSGPAIAFPTKLMAYILANPKHDYYMSLWARVTRAPLDGFGNSTMVAINGNAQQTNSYLFNVAASSSTAAPWATLNRPSAGVPRLGFHEDGTVAALGNKFLSLATDQWFTLTTTDALPGDGTNPAVTGAQAGGGLTFGSTVQFPGIGTTGTVANGTFNPASSASNVNKSDSHIIYRFYLEDLTVSGRTYAEVDALSWAEYQRQVLTVGGRYYGDTFTNPTSIP